MSESDRVQSEFERIYGEWMDAAATADAAWYHDNLADEFVYLTVEGDELSRDDIIDVAALSINSEYRLLKLTARQYGDVVFAYGRYFGSGDFDETAAISDELRAKYGHSYSGGCELAFSGTWVTRAGRYQCLHLQSVEVASKTSGAA